MDVGVCNIGDDEDPVPSVGSADSRSRNKHRLDGISEMFKVSADSFDGEGLSQGVLVNIVTLSKESGTASQVSAYPSFDHSGDSSNVLTNDPSGPDFANSAEHFRPEVTVVVPASPLSGIGERLAGESPGEYVDPSPPFGEVRLCDVFITYTIREPILQHGPPEGVDFTMEGVPPSHYSRRHLRAAYAGKQ